MAATAKTPSKYLVFPKENGEVGKYEVLKVETLTMKPMQEKPYVVTLIAEWAGARCSCPDGIFRARKLGRPCKHEWMVREMVEKQGACAGLSEAMPQTAKKEAA